MDATADVDIMKQIIGYAQQQANATGQPQTLGQSVDGGAVQNIGTFTSSNTNAQGQGVPTGAGGGSTTNQPFMDFINMNTPNVATPQNPIATGGSVPAKM